MIIYLYMPGRHDVKLYFEDSAPLTLKVSKNASDQYVMMAVLNDLQSTLSDEAKLNTLLIAIPDQKVYIVADSTNLVLGAQSTSVEGGDGQDRDVRVRLNSESLDSVIRRGEIPLSRGAKRLFYFQKYRNFLSHPRNACVWQAAKL